MDIQKLAHDLVLPALPPTVQPCTLHLINSIKAADLFALKEFANSLCKEGRVQHVALFSIPVGGRVLALSKAIGDKPVHILLAALLFRFQQSFNLDNVMNADQMTECAFDLLLKGKEYHCALEDYAVFFERAKSNTYGKIYNRLDPATILALFDKYLDERYDAIATIREEQHLAYGQIAREEESADQKAMRGLSSIGGALAGMREQIEATQPKLSYPNSKLEPHEIKPLIIDRNGNNKKK